MPSNSLTFRDLRNAILFATLIFIIVVFIRDIVDVILLFTIVTLLVIILDPFVTRMNKHKIPRWAGTLIVVVVFLGIIALILYYIVPVAIAQFKQLATTIPKLLREARSWVSHISSRFGAGGAAKSFSIATVWRYAQPLVGGLARITHDIAYVVAGAVAIFITTIYALINPRPLIAGFLNALNPAHRPRIEAAGERVAIQIWAWARGTIFAMLTIFALVWLDLWLLGFKQALLFAIIAGILEIIPVIGPILGGVLPFFVGLTIKPILAVWVVATFVVIQQFENHILIPQVMSRQVRLHPVTVIVFVFIMGALFGIIGIFLATPTAVIVGVLYDELYLCEYRKRCEEAGIEKSEEEKRMDEEREREIHAQEAPVEHVIRIEQEEGGAVKAEQMEQPAPEAAPPEQPEEEKKSEEGEKPLEEREERAKREAEEKVQRDREKAKEEYGPHEPGTDNNKES